MSDEDKIEKTKRMILEGITVEETVTPQDEFDAAPVRVCHAERKIVIDMTYVLARHPAYMLEMTRREEFTGDGAQVEVPRV